MLREIKFRAWHVPTKRWIDHFRINDRGVNMKKQKTTISISDPGWKTMTLEERNAERIDFLTNLVEKYRRTNIFYLITGLILGAGATFLGIGIGLWTGVL